MKAFKWGLLAIVLASVHGCGPGEDGANGISCLVMGGNIVCTNGTSIKISEQGVQNFDPCGDGPGQDELLLILADGTILSMRRGILTELTNGNYRTKDKQKCRFSVLNGDVLW